MTTHITQPYTLDELRAKVASHDYNAELLLQHAMLLLTEDARDAARYRWLRDNAQTRAVIRWSAPSGKDEGYEGSDHEHEVPLSEMSGFNARGFDAAIDAAMSSGTKTGEGRR